MEPNPSSSPLGQFARGTLILIIGIIIGAVAMYFLAPRIYLARFNAAKNFPRPLSAQNQNAIPVSGTVTALDGSRLTLALATNGQFGGAPTGAGSVTGTVLIATSTQVFSLTPKGVKAFQAEFDAFFNKNPEAVRALLSGTGAPDPAVLATIPSPFLRTPLPPERIKIGDFLLVTPLEVTAQKELVAKEIQVQSQTASSSAEYLKAVQEIVAKEMQTLRSK